jgi:hypothetical protein
LLPCCVLFQRKRILGSLEFERRIGQESVFLVKAKKIVSIHPFCSIVA